MKKTDRNIFFGAAVQNAGPVLLHAALGTVALLGTICFTSLVALYFGHDVMSLGKYPDLNWLFGTPANVILAATISAAVGLISRVWQTILEARVVIGRERWFAEKLRAEAGAPAIVGNIPRASNYYGRLAVSAMKAMSTATILLLNVATIIFFIPRNTAVVGFAGLSVIALLLYVAMRFLSSVMSNSSSNLSAHAKSAANWKATPAQAADENVEAYYQAYFYRIFLASSFGFAVPLFGIVFCLIIIALREMIHVEFSFAQAFVTFAVMQSYVGLMGKLFGSLVHGAAFIPAVRPYLHPASDATHAVRVDFPDVEDLD